MKFLAILFLAAALLALLLPAAIGSLHPYPPAQPAVTAAPSEAKVPSPSPPSVLPDPAAAPGDAAVSLRLLHEGSLLTLTMEQYLFGVVASEMPAEFDHDALCAQAVAARSTTLHHILGAEHPAHPRADMCSSAACCEAWLPEETLMRRWGAAYEENAAKIRAAVAETDGTVVLYDAQPALCVFHSASAGITESSADVWGGALPYLVSVESPETPETVPGYVTTVTVPQTEFRNILLEHCPDADLSGLPEGWITQVSVTGGGRVAEMTVGGVRIAGTTLRSLFDLRSAAFTVEVTHDSMVFTVTGYGHGVGMSQYGANILAEDGTPWQDILAWYYPGTELGNLSDFAA